MTFPLPCRWKSQDSPSLCGVATFLFPLPLWRGIKGVGSFPSLQAFGIVSIPNAWQSISKKPLDISLTLNMTTQNEQAKSAICHLKRSEVSKEVSKNTRASNADVYVQNSLDISVFCETSIWQITKANIKASASKKQTRHKKSIFTFSTAIAV